MVNSTYVYDISVTADMYLLVVLRTCIFLTIYYTSCMS